MEIPLLLLNFNRPDFTLQVIQNLRVVQPKFLYIAQDGPRKSHVKDKENCDKVTTLLTREIDWECDKHYLIRTENLGCRKAVSEAISWFFSQVIEGIILEDDCLLAPDFYPFCNEMLEKYRNTPSVAMITSYNPGVKLKNSSYYFSQHAGTIGWATWKDRWEGFDLSMPDFNDFLESGRIDAFSSDSLINSYILDKWQESFENRNNSWAYRWYYHMYITNTKCIVPSKNLLINTGINTAEATNTKTHFGSLNHLIHEKLEWPLIPPIDKENSELDNQLFYLDHKSRFLLLTNYYLPNWVKDLLRPIYVWLGKIMLKV